MTFWWALTFDPLYFQITFVWRYTFTTHQQDISLEKDWNLEVVVEKKGILTPKSFKDIDLLKFGEYTAGVENVFGKKYQFFFIKKVSSRLELRRD